MLVYMVNLKQKDRVFPKFKPQKYLLKLFLGIKDQSTINYQKLSKIQIKTIWIKVAL